MPRSHLSIALADMNPRKAVVLLNGEAVPGLRAVTVDWRWDSLTIATLEIAVEALHIDAATLVQLRGARGGPAARLARRGRAAAGGRRMRQGDARGEGTIHGFTAEATLRRRTIAYALIDAFVIACVLGWELVSGASRREASAVVAIVGGLNLAFDIARLAPAWWGVRRREARR